MIVCPGCGGRNEPGAFACAFCNRRVDVSEPGAMRQRQSAGAQDAGALASRTTLLRRVLLASLLLVLLLLCVVLFVLRASLFGKPT